MSKKSIIGVVTSIQFATGMGTDHIYVNDEYIISMEKIGAVPVMIPVVTTLDILDIYIDMCDGFLFTGGVDINPIHFKKGPHRKLGTVNNKLDNFQIILMKKVISSGKPFLAICRGIQLLSVVLGGTLYQDLDEVPGTSLLHEQKSERYCGIHQVYFQPDSKLYEIFGESTFVNSYHHQCVASPGRNVHITGKTSDNVVEAVELANYNFGIGVQWHPEMMFACTGEMETLFRAFLDATES
ncbi:MAG TPA: gamma-glutamyl-gamma-aminobutyrate hydrolase family protein [Lachnospiraceae bacterium]|nr:gamma-glutamyl-gamma-aminobutyrate hydrolase family protein [Lachnospiraceae bacterium]